MRFDGKRFEELGVLATICDGQNDFEAKQGWFTWTRKRT